MSISNTSKLILSAFVLVAAQKANAQFKASGFEAGIQLGTFVYQGELTSKFYGYTRNLKPAVNLHASKYLNDYFAVRGSAWLGKVAANEGVYTTPEWHQYRNFKFSTALTELSGLIVFNPYGNDNAKAVSRVSPYFLAGAGVTFINTKRDYSGFNTTYFDVKSVAAQSLAADTVKTLPTMITVLPIGAGIKYMLSSRIALNAEATYRFTSTDYLDGFKHNDSKNNRDSYYGISLGINYIFGKNRYNCPKIK